MLRHVVNLTVYPVSIFWCKLWLRFWLQWLKMHKAALFLCGIYSITLKSTKLHIAVVRDWLQHCDRTHIHAFTVVGWQTIVIAIQKRKTVLQQRTQTICKDRKPSSGRSVCAALCGLFGLFDLFLWSPPPRNLLFLFLFLIDHVCLVVLPLSLWSVCICLPCLELF